MTISVSTDFCNSSNAAVGDAHPAHAFELERLGHDADGENAEFARSLGDNGRRARAGAAAHAGGDEAPYARPTDDRGFPR